ncbi:hypothetical protein ACWDXD_25215 [Streptomyces sp. NPDC003314]
MVNRPADLAEFLAARGLEIKAARRRWNPALHPRDSKGRFIETGGVVRLWGGKLARVVRALPNDRILVQDQTGPDQFTGRRHTTSAKWVSMVARPDGTAPTDNEEKVQEEDQKRLKDQGRGNGVALDDDGDPATPNTPHVVDDQGRPIGDDEDDGPDDDDDEDEPADGRLPINVSALPNRRHNGDGRFDDVAAVRQHFLDLADAPGQDPDMAEFLRFAAGIDDLKTTDDGSLVIMMDGQTGGWYLTASGTGQRMRAAGKFDTPKDAARFARHLELTAPTEDSQAASRPVFDFSDPDLDTAAKTWRSHQGENIPAAIRRAREEFDAGKPPAPRTPKADSAKKPEAQPLEFDWDNPDDMVTLTMPAAVAVWLLEDDTWDGKDPDTRKALEEAQRRKDGTLRVTAPMDVHHILLDLAEVLSGNYSDASPAEIRGYNNYAKRVTDANEEMRRRKAEREANAPNAEAPDTDAPSTAASGAGSSTPAPEAAARAAEEDNGPDKVTLTPDEVNAPAAAAHAAKAPSSMDDEEIRDEIVSLVEREMANGGELSGVDRTRMRVLEAEEARRGGRKPKEEPKPKPKAPSEDAGGLFDIGQGEQQRHAPDPDNPMDRPDDEFGTPDLFAAAEGRDTSRLRSVQTRAPQDFQEGDRFVDAEGRTHTVQEPPVRTGRGRIRVVSEGGREHFLAPDTELRVLAPDEDAPKIPQDTAPDADAPQTGAPEADAPSPVPGGGETAPDTPEQPDAPAPGESGTPEDADAPDNAEPAAVPDQVAIEHTGTGTVIRFPTPNGMVSDEDFAVLRRLGFKGSRDRTKPRFFYLPSNMTLSRRDDKVRQLKEWLDRRNVAYQAPDADAGEKPELSEEQLEQLKGKYSAPDGTWATTDFQPGDEVWMGGGWRRVDSLGPKNMRVQGWGATPYNRVLARRRGGEIRTMFDAPGDSTVPRPGTDDPKLMRDEQLVAELEHLNNAVLPEGNDPAARTVRRQVAARRRALTDAQSARVWERQRVESARRDQAAFVRSPERLATKKGEQVQGRDGEPIGAVYQPKKGKWTYVNREGRAPTRGGTPVTFTSRAAAITALQQQTDIRNTRAGEGWKYSAWEDVQPGDTVRVPELSRAEGTRARTVTGWSEPIEVSEIRRSSTGRVLLTGRRGDEDVDLELSQVDATFGTSKPGTVPERERSEAGGGLPWQQMTPEDFGQDERPVPAPDQDEPRPNDETGTPDLIANGTPEISAQPPATEVAPEAPRLPRNENETARAIRDRLPGLPVLPKLTGLSRQDKDTVRRIRGDYAKVRESLDGIVSENPPTGDATEDLRRTRENLDYIAQRLTGDLLPDSEQAQTVRSALHDLGQDLDRMLAALPEREPAPQGEGPNGGTLFRPWDLRDGDLVRFDATNPADREGGLAPYYGIFRGASTASGDHGRTLVGYQGRSWNDDRQQWEPDVMRHTVTMPPRGLVERFTEEQWDAWRRPQRSDGQDAPEVPKAPPVPVGEARPSAMSDEEIDAELERLEAWRQRHVMRTGEGPHVEGNLILALGPMVDRKGYLHEEQRKREVVRQAKERREKEKQERDNALARTAYGDRNEDGSYPVAVDLKPGGTVYQLSGRKWQYRTTEGNTGPELYTSRANATAALVYSIDVRRERDERNGQSQEQGGTGGDQPLTAPDQAGRARAVFGEGMNAVGGESLPEMQELDERLGRAGSADDPDAELRDVAERMDALAEQYELAGPQGELAADRFRRAARLARGEQDDQGDDRAERNQDEEEQNHGTQEEPSLAALVADIPAPTGPSRYEETDEEAAFRFGGRDRIQEFADLAEVRSGEFADADTVWLDGRRIGHISNLYRNRDREPLWEAVPFFGYRAERDSRLRGREAAIASLVVQALQDGPPDPANPSGRMWDSVGSSLASLNDELPELPPRLQNNPEIRARYDRITATIDAFRARQLPSGDLRQDLAQAGDDFAWLHGVLSDVRKGGPSRDELRALDRRAYLARSLLDGFGPDDDLERPRPNASRDDDTTTPDAPAPEVPDETGDEDGSDRENDDRNTSEDENEDENEEDDEQRRRRRRRRDREGGNGGPGGPGGPGLPRLNLPDSSDSGAGGNGDGASGRGAAGPRHQDVDSLRAAWRSGEGLTPAEDTPERREYLSRLAEQEGLVLSPGGALVAYPSMRGDGTMLWRFARARNGMSLPGADLSTSNPAEARALAGRFETLTESDGSLFNWGQSWNPEVNGSWRDGQGRTLTQAIRSAVEDHERERANSATLPADLTVLSQSDLEASFRNDLSPEDMTRLMAEMDRRDRYVDQRIRAAVPDTPPADAADAEARGRAMDAALGFGDTDVVRPQRTREEALRAEFADIDEARYQAAQEATRGLFFRREFKYGSAPFNERDLFSGGGASAFGRWRQYASEELQEWFDANGGRLTYNEFKNRRRHDDRAAREDYENGRLAAAGAAGQPDVDAVPDTDVTPAGPVDVGTAAVPSTPRFGDISEVRDRITNGDLDAPSDPDLAPGELPERIANNPTMQLSPGGRLVIRDRAAESQTGTGGWYVSAPGSMETLLHDGTLDEEQARSYTRVLEKIRDENGELFPWDAPDAAERARTFRSADGDTLGVAIARQLLADHETGDLGRWDGFRLRGARDMVARDQARAAYYDTWRAEQEADGFTIPLDVHDTQAGDQVVALDPFEFYEPVTERVRLDGELTQALGDRSGYWPFAIGGNYRGTNAQGVVIRNGTAYDFSRASGTLRVTHDPGRPTAFRRPRPGEAERPQPAPRDQPGETVPTPQAETTPPARRIDSSTTAPAGTSQTPLNENRSTEENAAPPEPVGGRPAHWARVEDLVPGDMVRMDGTNRRGRATQRAGYVGGNGPVLVEVTRNGRTEQRRRTWITENPDGTGASGNVFTPVNATAARAEAPDDIVPGSPASGAQAALRSGGLPGQIPADREGRGLFPGSTVTGPNDREGVISGATSTTVSVDWSDGRDEDVVSPTSLTVTDSQRPDGWTGDGQRVTAQSVVSDRDGAFLGPVSEVDGDAVTITTASGTVTRSASDLRVTGEVRNAVPAPGPVAGIDEPTAAELKDGDVVVLDLDGRLTTVALTGTPDRDGDRVTLQYADTTTGEIGEIDVDARAVFSRAHGPDGGAPDLGPDDAPEPGDDLVIHAEPRTIEPVTGPVVDPDLGRRDREVIEEHADGPDDNPDVQQAAARITADLPITPEQATALAEQLRAAADPSSPEGRAALRAANHLDRAAGRTPPPGVDRPRPANVAQLAGGDLVAVPGDRDTDRLRVYRVVGDPIDAPGGIRSLHLEDEDGRRHHRIEHGDMPVWQLPEAEPDPVTPPDPGDTPNAPATPGAPSASPVPPAPSGTGTPAAPSAPAAPELPVARARPGQLRVGDVIEAPVNRRGYQLNDHRRLTIISGARHSGWWTYLTGIDENGNVHDVGLHTGREVNVYDRGRPTPALPPSGAPRDPNPAPETDVDRLVGDHARSMAARIIQEAIAGTEPPGGIHALREQIAQRLTGEALRDARQAARRDGAAALDIMGISGDHRTDAQRRLTDARKRAHQATVRAALRTINDLEPLPDESDEDLAARARDLLRLIPDQVANRQRANDRGDADINRAVGGHIGEAVNTLLQQLQAAGVDPGDADRLAQILTQQMGGSRQRTARRIASRVAAASPAAGRQPGLLAQIVALLMNLAKRLVELVKAAGRKIAEKYRDTRERMARMRAFLGRLGRRVRQWPESRRLARLHRAVNLPDADGDTLAARVSHWAGLMPEAGRFGQSQRRVTFWRPTTWGQLAAGRLPSRSDRIRWTPDQAADGGPGLTGLRHLAALRAAGTDVDQDVTRRLAAALGDDFGPNPHETLQHADDYVADSERRLVSLQAARRGGTIPDDPDLEIEIDTARTELTAARREYADLRARYAAAVPDAVAASLGDVREMGPQGSAALVFDPDTTPDAERAVRGVQRLIPRSWLNSPEVRRLTAVDGDQGRYEAEGQRVTVADLADGGLSTAGHALAQHFARHLGDLDAAQRAYWFTRTHTGRPGARRMRPTALDRLLRRQRQTQRETGDTLARSIQDMFSGDWYQDDDLRAFLLGLMATR